jgi:hypothetical protein
VPSRGVGRYLSPGYDIVVRVVSSCRKKEETRNASTLILQRFRCGPRGAAAPLMIAKMAA